ncbi:MAG: hypothetical protein D6736_04720, partial [Nitrospinota bacterium]
MNPRLFVILMLALAFMGCASPNIEPFAQATGALRQAIIESGAVTADAMAAAATTVPNQPGNDDAEEFVAIW